MLRSAEAEVFCVAAGVARLMRTRLCEIKLPLLVLNYIQPIVTSNMNEAVAMIAIWGLPTQNAVVLMVRQLTTTPLVGSGSSFQHFHGIV